MSLRPEGDRNCSLSGGGLGANDLFGGETQPSQSEAEDEAGDVRSSMRRGVLLGDVDRDAECFQPLFQVPA